MPLFFAQQAKNMGRLAAAIAVVGLLLCGALLGLMFAANEASKEGHVDGSVSVDLTGSPVQSKPLQSFGSLLDFPKMDATLLNELDFVSFSVQDGRLGFHGALMTSGKRRLSFGGALMTSGKGFVVPPGQPFCIHTLAVIDRVFSPTGSFTFMAGEGD
jgi:hypothetical protein